MKLTKQHIRHERAAIMARRIDDAQHRYRSGEDSDTLALEMHRVENALPSCVHPWISDVEYRRDHASPVVWISVESRDDEHIDDMIDALTALSSAMSVSVLDVMLTWPGTGREPVAVGITSGLRSNYQAYLRAASH